MKKILFVLLTLMAAAFTFTACSESEDPATEYDNWQARNEAYFAEKLQLAKDSIAIAKAKYGDSWEDSCNWRTYVSWTLTGAEAYATSQDSIVVQILTRGTGTTTPNYTDSVRVRYRGLLMPTTSNPTGYVFDHTGLYTDFDRTFDQQTAGSVVMTVAGAIKGYSTALMNMHEGDLWRVYIPANLGYGSTATTKIPAYSCLTFDIQNVKIYGPGTAGTTYQAPQMP